jgi:inhibitor of KinA sporulation pathway (predicted exonuclease)
MRYVIVDLEATCWQTGTNPSRMEIIEIGAVLLDSGDMQPIKEFGRFVKPIVEPVLSAFCTQLTSIQQHDIDNVEHFYTVFPAFLDWIGPEPFMLCSWGAYDLNQFRTDCQRHGIPFPATFERHINLKKAFAQWKHVKPCGMKAALAMLNLPLEGQHHRGIDDARNIARIAQQLLPQIEKSMGEEFH